MSSKSSHKCPCCKGLIDLPGRHLWHLFKPFPCPHCGTLIVKRLRSIILFFLGLEICAGTIFFNPDNSNIALSMVKNGHYILLFFLMVIWVILSLAVFFLGCNILKKFYLYKSKENM